MIKAGCGGLIVVDKETALITKVLWARILVSLKGKERPSTINILENVRSYELQIWWELPSWIAGVYSTKGSDAFENHKPGEEGECSTRGALGACNLKDASINVDLKNEDGVL